MKKVIETVKKSEKGLLITTYEHLRIYAAELLSVNWGYAVLDEGHKIKNPDAEITLLVKQVKNKIANRFAYGHCSLERVIASS